ncbi:hypothetical protein SAMN03159343_0918 [Klenkia marina]|uniref:Uncharacterized protein n=1 Tax=Klenkia marina TaxID=1960309 RepID=A0A1G4XGA1_9ACTN|nr:DUF5946 family protein [Klenkia marina]SCX40250.1 hypothetical protein SAMN03159343_0918 [Klenkia marina]
MPAARPADGSPPPPHPPTLVSRCPGCGAVLAVAPGLEARHPGASPGCTRLFDVTVRGLRDEAPSDLRAAALLDLAGVAYDAQHSPDGEPVQRLRAALGEGARRPVRDHPPTAWRTTVADVAADLDVVDLSTLVRSWAQAVSADWAGDDA